MSIRLWDGWPVDQGLIPSRNHCSLVSHSASSPMGTRDSFPGKKQLQHEADSPPISAKVKNVWNFVAIPQISSWHWLIKHRDNFAFYKVEKDCMSFQNCNIRRMYLWNSWKSLEKLNLAITALLCNLELVYFTDHTFRSPGCNHNKDQINGYKMWFF
jgi:hypothetical protein